MLYEEFEPSWKGAKNDEVALGHYNHALRLIASEKNTSVVLIVSILFTCIEFLRGNTDAAITHCRHGMLLSNSLVNREAAVSAELQHLAVFPYFFARGDFPVLTTSTPAAQFSDISVAAMEMDELLGRAIRLVRSLDGYRLGTEEAAMPVGAWDLQQTLLSDLKKWKLAFEALPYNRLSDKCCGRPLLMMRFLVCWIWTSIAPYREETASDTFQNEFAQIVKLAGESSPEHMPESRFIFGMGTSPLLHFVVLKCRHLSTRLAALDALWKIGSRRESLWDTITMYAIGKLIIDREHGIMFMSGIAAAKERLPDDDCRIRDSYVEDGILEDQDEQGNVLLRRKIYLFVPAGEAIVKVTDSIFTFSNRPS
ncbi:hypothetical protein KJ359_008713 [Pestalotiopsis sp. 9143b]|nr:hypothetical protein KJ359_008713 [Pestalotiopsis sp. 9143b]